MREKKDNEISHCRQRGIITSANVTENHFSYKADAFIYNNDSFLK